jgi:hypothetical protein
MANFDYSKYKYYKGEKETPYKYNFNFEPSNYDELFKWLSMFMWQIEHYDAIGATIPVFDDDLNEIGEKSKSEGWKERVFGKLTENYGGKIENGHRLFPFGDEVYVDLDETLKQGKLVLNRE